MPHKINPIDFENAEGNFGLSTALLSHFSHKLPISRFQRDLSDSTVMRNVGTAFAYHLQAIKSIERGLGRVSVNEESLLKELDSHYELLAEPVQTVMRKYDIPNPYEKLKEFTRGKDINREMYENFVGLIGLPDEETEKIQQLKPSTYTGCAEQLAKDVDKYI